MKRRLAIGGVLLLSGLLLWKILAPPTPRYKGKDAEEWFYQYYTTGTHGAHAPGDHEEAKIALTVLATNSVPFLVHESRHPRRDTVVTMLRHEIRRFFLRGTVGRYISGTNIAQEAEFVIRDIRPSAEIVMPLVTNWLADPKRIEYRSAIFFLGCVGEGAEQGIPHLANALTNTSSSPWARGLAAQSLLWLGRKSRPALPAMLSALNATNTTPTVFKAIGSLGPDAREALPLLQTKLSTTTDKVRRSHIAAALFSIDPTRTDALEVLRQSVGSENAPNERTSAIFALRHIGPAASATAPLLVELASSTNTHISGAALNALEKVSPERATGLLRNRMDSQEPNVAIWAAGALLRINPNDTNAVAYLTNFLATPDRDSSWDHYALEQIGEGAYRDDIITLLETLSKAGGNSNTRQNAEQSLKRLRLKQESKNK